MHHAGRNNTNQFPGAPQGESYMQQSSRIAICQGMKTRLFLTVSRIFKDKQGFIEKNLLRFRLIDVVLIRALAAIALVPVEASRAFQAIHPLYISHIYTKIQLGLNLARISHAIACFPGTPIS